MGLGVADYDDDGRTDVFVANDTVPNFLFRNLGNGKFTEIGFSAGVAYPDAGRPLSSVGVDSRDVDDDGKPDIFHTDSVRRPTRFDTQVTSKGNEMKISLFYEFPLPRPWSDDDEHKLFQDGLDEVEAADKAGFSTVWLTEHHFLEEYCHSTAPEIFLSAASQRTKDIRLGFGIMHLPPAVDHPARVAERVSTLDLLSNGRGRVRHR